MATVGSLSLGVSEKKMQALICAHHVALTASES
jgi:hypothetical protein